jgi:hypothetical protein
MLKAFTLKYEERTESINDSVMSNFLADKEILRWGSHFFERITGNRRHRKIKARKIRKGNLRHNINCCF